MNFIKTAHLFIFSLFIFIENPVYPESSPVFSVIGVTNHVKDKEWQDKGIGFGLSSLISQYVHDSGCFTAVEENMEIKKAIQDHHELFWKITGKVGNADIQNAKQHIPAEILFYGEVLKCMQKKTRLGVGPFGKYKTTVRVTFRLNMIEAESGKKLSSTGTGYSEKGASTIIFEVRDSKINFNSTMAGIACQEAVKNAVDEILLKYKNEKIINLY